MAGVPASETSATSRPARSAFEDLLTLEALVVLEVGGGGSRLSRAPQQLPRVPGVLAGDERDLAQDPQRPQGHVLEVPERRRDDVERA